MPKLRRRAKPLLGTLVDITVDVDVVDATHGVDSAIDAAFAEVAAVQRLMSFHDEDSDLARINRAAVGEAIEIEMRTAEVLQAAQRAEIESQGLFDCTIAAELVVTGLLPFLPGSNLPPPEQAVRPGRRWRLDGNACVKLAPCLIDLGGIAKGYAVDRAIAVLQAHGIGNALVNAGGDLRHIGDRACEVYLRDPADPGHLPLAVSVQGEALASSACGGLTIDGMGSRSALIDGVSRLPIGIGAGVTIAAPTCMNADLLTKVVLASRNTNHAMLKPRMARVIRYCTPEPA